MAMKRQHDDTEVGQGDQQFTCRHGSVVATKKANGAWVGGFCPICEMRQ